METCAYLIKSPSEVRLARTLLYALGGKRRWICLPVCLSPRGMLLSERAGGMRRNRNDGRLLPGLVDSLLLCVSDGAVVGAELASRLSSFFLPRMSASVRRFRFFALPSTGDGRTHLRRRPSFDNDGRRFDGRKAA